MIPCYYDIFERQQLANAIYSVNNQSSLLPRHTGCRIIKHAHNLFIALNLLHLKCCRNAALFLNFYSNKQGHVIYSNAII